MPPPEIFLLIKQERTERRISGEERMAETVEEPQEGKSETQEEILKELQMIRKFLTNQPKAEAEKTTTEEMTEEKQPPEGEEPKKKKRLKVIRRFGKDFMDFIRKYKVLGMAVAFIMATYVGLLVQALVDDIIMPLFTYIPGLNNLDRLNDWVVGNFYIGHFLSTSITFIAVAFVIYLIIKIGTKLGAEVEE